MAQVNFYKYNTTTSLQENKSNIEEGSIVFDNEAKILYLVTKANTLEPYYGTDTKYSFSSSNNVLRQVFRVSILFSSGLGAG